MLLMYKALIVLIILKFAYAGWDRSTEEFIPSKFFKKFDAEVSPYEALKFNFPKDEGFVAGRYPKCARHRFVSGADQSCQETKGTQNIGKTCKTRRCTQYSYYGSTKCNKIVKLYKPFKHSAMECKFPNIPCGESENEYQRHVDTFSSFHPHDTDDKECECQTIWCLGNIWTIYEEGGKLYKGNITVKTPCKCECRMPFRKMENWSTVG
ncbi:uncharacterized protein LOC120329504 isoform X1 [Styela clava]